MKSRFERTFEKAIGTDRKSCFQSDFGFLAWFPQSGNSGRFPADLARIGAKRVCHANLGLYAFGHLK